LRLKSFSLTHPEFLLYYLRSEFGRQQIISISGTAAITNISQDSLKTINIPIPSLPEQQKIAACLSSLDELITAQSQKLDALKKHKKGLMQQLFPT
jgi:type I restriction enzyme, S subunit